MAEETAATTAAETQTEQAQTEQVKKTEQATEPRTFSQAELDKIVQDRLAREAKKYDGFDDLKTKAAEFDKLQEAQKTELQKATDRATELEKKANAAEARAKDTALRAAIIGEAAKQGADPDVAAALVTPQITFNDSGDPEGVAEAITALLEAKPFLKADGGSRGNADQGARDGAGANQLGRAALDSMSPDQVTKALNEGRFDTLLRGA